MKAQMLNAEMQFAAQTGSGYELARVHQPNYSRMARR